jgi:hypothetical protein
MEAIKRIQELLFENKEALSNDVYVQLMNNVQNVYTALDKFRSFTSGATFIRLPDYREFPFPSTPDYDYDDLGTNLENMHIETYWSSETDLGKVLFFLYARACDLQAFEHYYTLALFLIVVMDTQVTDIKIFVDEFPEMVPTIIATINSLEDERRIEIVNVLENTYTRLLQSV